MAPALHTARWAAPGGSGRPVLLVHGLGGCTLEWEPVAPGLAGALGADVVAVDLPGFGRSRLPHGRAGVAAGVTAVTALLDDLGPAVVVANSMGGLVALGVAARRPEAISRLVLVGPALATASTPGQGVRTIARYAVALTPGVGPAVLAARRRRTAHEAHVERRLAAIVADPSRVAADVRARMVELAAERAAYTEAARCYSDAARSIFTGLRTAWRAVREVPTPTLVVHGRRDALVPVSVVDRLRAVRPDWTYEVFDDGGHLPHLELPDRFVEVVGAWVRG